MKEKNKSILKGLGVGALAVVGMVGLTGCANISKKDFNKIMNTVDTVENAISDFEAASIYDNAMNKIVNTSSNFWNNMKVEITISYSVEDERDVKKQEMIMLKHNDENIALWKSIGETDEFENNEYNVIYSQEDKVYEIDKEIDGYHKSEKDGYFYDATCGIFNDLFLGTWNGNDEIEFFKSSDIVSATKNESGNYVITMMSKDIYIGPGNTVINSYIIHNEIDRNCNLISQTIDCEEVEGDSVLKYSIVNKFSYGNVQYEDIQEEFEALVDYE